MVKANNTILQFYLAMMDSFGEYLSEKYSISSSIEDTKHYQTVIISKIVQMFHSIELLTKNTLDEVSARCVLRGILDSVTAYSFIYQREGENDMLFRHYLYALDGWREYKKSVITISEGNECNYKQDYACDIIIKQIEDKLRNHIYYTQDSSKAEELIRKANWKYKSFQTISKLSYIEMYKEIKFDTNTSDYYLSYFSQFVHGLCISNKHTASPEQMKRVSCECIPIADKFIQSITQTFYDKEMMNIFIGSDIIQNYLNSKEFVFNDLSEFAIGLVRKDKTILI